MSRYDRSGKLWFRKKRRKLKAAETLAHALYAVPATTLVATSKERVLARLSLSTPYAIAKGRPAMSRRKR